MYWNDKSPGSATVKVRDSADLAAPMPSFLTIEALWQRSSPQLVVNELQQSLRAGLNAGPVAGSVRTESAAVQLGLARWRRAADVDDQPAAGRVLQGDAAVHRLDETAGDRQPQPHPGAGADRAVVPPLERLRTPRSRPRPECPGRGRSPAVPPQRLPVLAGGDPHRSAGRAVAHRVLQHVRDHPLEQPASASTSGRSAGTATGHRGAGSELVAARGAPRRPGRPAGRPPPARRPAAGTGPAGWSTSAVSRSSASSAVASSSSPIVARPLHVRAAQAATPRPWPRPAGCAGRG